MAWYRGSDDGDVLPDIDLAKYNYLEVKFAHRDEAETDITGVARVGATFQNRDHGRFVLLEVLACDDGYYQWWLNQPAQQRLKRPHRILFQRAGSSACVWTRCLTVKALTHL